MQIPALFSQVNFRYTGLACPTGAENVIGVTNVGDDDPAVVAAAAISAWVTNIAPLVVNDLTLSEVTVKNGPNATGLMATVGSGATGTATSAGMTPQNALLVRKNTTHGGRKGRGRLFLPGITEGTANEAGEIAAGTVAIYQAGFDAFFAQLSTTGIAPVLLHNDSTSPYPIVSFTVASLMATQRDRIRRR